MNAKTVQTAAFVVPALSILFLPFSRISVFGSWLTGGSFLAALYISAIAAVVSTVVRYRGEEKKSLPEWRSLPYATGIVLLLVFCALPIASWTIVLADARLHIRVAVLCLVGLNSAAALLVWFGRGWSRLGLTVVAYWICFLWVFPLGLRE